MRTALSMSQSLKMMRGDFPPSSRDTFFRLLTAQLRQGITGRKKRAWSFAWQSRQPGEQLAELVWSYLFMICLPIGVEPVKPSLRMSGWSDKRCPTMPPAGKKGIGKVGYRSMTKRKVYGIKGGLYYTGAIVYFSYCQLISLREKPTICFRFPNTFWPPFSIWHLQLRAYWLPLRM